MEDWVDTASARTLDGPRCPNPRATASRIAAAESLSPWTSAGPTMEAGALLDASAASAIRRTSRSVSRDASSSRGTAAGARPCCPVRAPAASRRTSGEGSCSARPRGSTARISAVAPRAPRIRAASRRTETCWESARRAIMPGTASRARVAWTRAPPRAALRNPSAAVTRTSSFVSASATTSAATTDGALG